MKPQLWFIDVDGCLSGGKFKRFDVTVLREIEAFIQERQLHVVLCTGRSLSYLEALHQVFDWGRYALSDHGALLYDTQLDQYRIHPRLSISQLEALPQLSASLAARGRENGLWRLSHGKQGSVSLVLQEGDALSLQALLHDEMVAQGFETHASGTVLDMVPAGINKWAGATWYAEMQHLSASNWAAIGDSHGDLPLLTRVDFAACPQNAHADVKNICHAVSTETAARGVLDLLQRYS